MPVSIKRRIRRYAIWALALSPVLAAYHYAMVSDQEALCERGEMYGKDCY